MNIWSKFVKNVCGTSAVEFSLVVLPFLMLMVGILELGYKSIQQSELDAAVYEISSRIAKTQYEAADADEFSQNRLCAEFGFSVLDCSQVNLGVLAVSGSMAPFRNTSIVGSWDQGCADDTLIIELHYPVTHLMHPFAIADVIEVSGTDFYRARGIVRREPVLSGTGVC